MPTSNAVPQDLFLRQRQADGVDRKVDTAAGEIFDRLHGVEILGIDAMGGAQRTGKI